MKANWQGSENHFQLFPFIHFIGLKAGSLNPRQLHRICSFKCQAPPPRPLPRSHLNSVFFGCGFSWRYAIVSIYTSPASNTFQPELNPRPGLQFNHKQCLAPFLAHQAIA